MADDKQQKGDELAPEIGDPGAAETDVLFRGQMAAANFFLGHWKKLLGALGVFLALALVFSLWRDYARDQQRDVQARISDVDRKMPRPDQLAMMGLTPLDDPADTKRMEEIKANAALYEAIARDSGGAGASMAWLRASQAWERAGDKAAARKALEEADKGGAEGILGWSIASRLAGLRAAEGDVDGAVALYKRYTEGAAATSEPVIAQQALIELALVYEGADRKADAAATLQDFSTRFPESALAPQAAEILARVQG